MDLNQTVVHLLLDPHGTIFKQSLSIFFLAIFSCNIVKVSILAKAINRVNEIIRKFKTAFFEEKMKCQNALIEKKHLRNKNQKLTIPYFRIYYKAKLIKICCIWNKDGPAE